MITIPAALLLALIVVESHGDDHAIRHGGPKGDEVGCLQITQGVVTDVNRILKRGTTAFKLKDCLDRQTSIFICQTYLKHYCDPKFLLRAAGQPRRQPTTEDLARCWHCGPDFQLEPLHAAGTTYWDAVKAELIAQGEYQEVVP